MKDRELINQFKAEYKARLYYDKRLDDLERQKQDLMDQFSVHSPNLDGIQVTPISRDLRLSELATKTQKIEDEEEYLLKGKARVDGIMCKIEPRLRKHMYNVYGGHYNLAEAAAREGITERQMGYEIDRAILRAIKGSL